jgi:hypothetical protein
MRRPTTTMTMATRNGSHPLRLDALAASEAVLIPGLLSLGRRRALRGGRTARYGHP